MDDANISKGLKRVNEWWVFLKELAKRGAFFLLHGSILHLGSSVSAFGPQAFVQFFAGAN